MGHVKASFFRLFVGGFVAGMLGMVPLQPAATTRAFGEPFHTVADR